MIVIDVGHSNIKVWEKSKKILSFSIDSFNEFEKYLFKNKNKKIYIGSVNQKALKSIINKLDFLKINYRIITHEDFKNHIKLSKEINLYEVGLDILSIIYQINCKNYLFINSGTALVYIKYSDKLDGVIISNNIFLNIINLLNKTSLKYEYTNNKTFAKNTSDAFSASINLQFVDMVNKLLSSNKIKKLYICNIEKRFLKNIKVDQIKNIDNATIKGYIKLITKNNI